MYTADATHEAVDTTRSRINGPSYILNRYVFQPIQSTIYDLDIIYARSNSSYRILIRGLRSIPPKRVCDF